MYVNNKYEMGSAHQHKNKNQNDTHMADSFELSMCKSGQMEVVSLSHTHQHTHTPLTGNRFQTLDEDLHVALARRLVQVEVGARAAHLEPSIGERLVDLELRQRIVHRLHRGGRITAKPETNAKPLIN